MPNPREIRGSKWSNPVNLERILVEIGASLGAFELHSHRIRARKRSKTTTSGLSVASCPTCLRAAPRERRSLMLNWRLSAQLVITADSS